MSVALTNDEVERFREQGYILIEEAFDEGEVAEMRKAADRILELTINSSLANDRTSGRLAMAEHEDGSQMVKKVQPVNDLSLAFTGDAQDDRLLEPMRAYMDDEPRLMEEKLNYKQPLPERVDGIDTNRPSEAWPVHSDWAYFRAQDYPQDVISSAVALDDLTADNGTMRLWPGTNDEFVEHERTDNGLEVPPDLVEDEEGELIEAPAGSLLLFDSLVWHGSSANTTDGPRRLMIYSHYPAGVGQERGIVEDERNAPSRRREGPYEWRYQEMKDEGEFEDQFEAPDTSYTPGHE
jgi:ectoine hydroxylase-related dioxygenase (phytanoyl-CoA dioxygenase family)